MSYEVTATRRRPQAFDSLAGQEFVAETLKNAIKSKKIAHAYLFAGPRGCGKTSTARILAKALNCEKGPTAEPCGECRFCKEITQGACTDVIEIDGASNTSVNDVRVIKDELLFPPQSARYKIYIIDEVHMLSTSAFNALLKTIEEPPPFAIFIFATTELQKVPATIKSRCQQYNFRLVSAEKVKELLAQAAAEIGIKADDEALYWIARESTGSVRDSYTLFDQVAAFSGDHITYEKIRDKLGLVGVERLNEIFECCAGGKTQDVMTKLDEFFQNGISIEQIITNSTDYLRSLLLIKNGVTKEALLGQSAERFSKIVLDAWNPVQIERALSLLFTLYRDIRYSLSPRYELELAFSRLSWLSEYVSPKEVKHAIDQARALLITAPQAQISVPVPQPVQIPRFVPQKQSPVQKPEPEPQAVPPHQESSQSFSSGGDESFDSISADPNDFRGNIIKKVMAKDKILGSYLIQTGEWKKEGNIIKTQTTSSFFKMQIEKNSASLSSIIREATGENLSLSIELKEIKVENPEEHAPLEVRILCDTFKGHIVGYSVKTAEEIERSKKEDSEKPADKEEDSQNSSESQSESAENTENMENDDSENE
ncbi:MAG: DNA polymerase III subunit gamma/tau [Treponema sp.]|nr:DNA polymerase III subunit gamma/tau [Treponema sp.]MBR0032117.1 DNA polymerase III subunit gamma/tau [Treponema sp.]